MGKLIDPNRPRYEVKVREDGSAQRNDGVELKAANDNPWYRLATVYEEQTGSEIDEKLHAQNRRIWNGWACSQMDAAAREALAEQLKLPVEDLAPLSEEELALARARLEGLDAAAFGKAGPGPDGLPDPRADVVFSNTHFSNTVVLEKCVFAADATFTSASFSGPASFTSTSFIWDASFDSASFSWFASFTSTSFSWFASFTSASFSGFAVFTAASFSGPASFSSASFSGPAWFTAASFSGPAFFDSASFIRDALFDSASFSKDATFTSASFSGYSNFSDGSFKGQTSFKSVKFEKMVPKFYQREMHQDTTFTPRVENWPEVTAENAEDSKQAYTRLRQIMLELEKPDDAQFFARQEMRCKGQLETGVARWANLGFGLISDYGYSLSRPLYGLAGIWAVGALIMAASFYISCHLHANECLSWTNALGLSFSNLFSFFGFGRLFFAGILAALPWWLQALAGFQTVSGFILLFFLGLGLRNHFRLK